MRLAYFVGEDDYQKNDKDLRLIQVANAAILRAWVVGFPVPAWLAFKPCATLTP